MQPLRGFLIVFILSLIACSRQSTTDIQGTWVMIEAYDRATSTYLTPPTGSQQVEITFDQNDFYGHTIMNAFGNGTFELDGNSIRFNSYIITQVLEDQWGAAFIEVLNSCLLQSVAPCTHATISLNGDILIIDTQMQHLVKLKLK